MYMMEDWRKDGTFKAKEGEEIEEKVYNGMLNVLPPLNIPRKKIEISEAKYNIVLYAGFLMSEPCAYENYKPLYAAFGCGNGHYYYLGLSYWEG